MENDAFLGKETPGEEAVTGRWSYVNIISDNPSWMKAEMKALESSDKSFGGNFRKCIFTLFL